MPFEWDPAKDAQNVARRGFSFAIVERLDWDTSVTFEDLRQDYGERRFVTFGLIDAELYVVVHTPRRTVDRVISMRTATKKEREWYATQT